MTTIAIAPSPCIFLRLTGTQKTTRSALAPLRHVIQIDDHPRSLGARTDAKMNGSPKKRDLKTFGLIVFEPVEVTGPLQHTLCPPEPSSLQSQSRGRATRSRSATAINSSARAEVLCLPRFLDSPFPPEAGTPHPCTCLSLYTQTSFPLSSASISS